MLYSRLIPLVALFGLTVLAEKDGGGSGGGSGGGDGEGRGGREDGKSVTTARPTTTKAARVEELCFPTDTAGIPLPDAPCNQLRNISLICDYDTVPSHPEETPIQKIPSDIQKCYCDRNGKGALFFGYLGG